MPKKKSLELAAYQNRWRVRKLIWIKDQLPPAVRAKYDAWVSVGGEPTHPGFLAWSGGMEVISDKSPITVDEFRALRLTEQVDFMRTWTPKENAWDAPSRTGLANVFKVAVGEETAAYITVADVFRDLRPEYIAAYFSSLWENLKDGPTAPMASVWALANWMLAQPDNAVEIVDGFTRSPRSVRPWYSARLALSRLVEGVLKATKLPLDAGEGTAVWEVLEQLASDPDPGTSAKAEQGNDDNAMGPFSSSLNTIRGGAIHGIIEYVAWRWRNTADKNEWAGIPAEAKALLEKFLDPAIEKTLTIRSVFGVSTPRLVFFDKEWFAQNREKIFPGAAQPKLNDTAWDNFITRVTPTTDVFELLREQFRHAIGEIKPRPNTRRNTDPTAALGRYLVTMYWNGLLDFTVPNDLLAKFYARADDEACSEVIDYVGRCLKATDVVSPEFAARFKKLWEWRLGIAKANAGHEVEMGSFGWWFDSGKLDLQWSAAMMLQALKVSRRHENQFLWMPRFAAIAAAEPVMAVKALQLTREIVRDRKGAHFFHEEEAKTIIREGLKAADAETVRGAAKARDAFLREGRNAFLDHK